MIVGMLAKAFKKYGYHNNDQVIIFASGVSNSQETRDKEFLREKLLLIEFLKQSFDQKLVYFSTCSIYDSFYTDSLYVKHNREMEELIKKHSKSYFIFRLPHVVGVTTNNKNTIVNFMYHKVLNDRLLTIWKNEKRNLIDIDDVLKIGHHIISKNMFVNPIINIASTQNTNVVNIVRGIELILGKKAKVQLLEKTSSYKIYVTRIMTIF
jgi:nucleoside-diphosphate-sugar epimerase